MTRRVLTQRTWQPGDDKATCTSTFVANNPPFVMASAPNGDFFVPTTTFTEMFLSGHLRVNERAAESPMCLAFS